MNRGKTLSRLWGYMRQYRLLYAGLFATMMISIAVNLGSWHCVRDYYGFVPQETQLSTGTIWDNISDGKSDATEEEVSAAAKHAYAYDFIMQLPNGFQTEIGERGSQLPGGQRQRISIARAILRNAPVLLLDEATAALDNESERLVQDALSRLMQDKTTLVTAHRLSTIRHADTILVMEDGSIVERGTHEELLALEGKYHALYCTLLQQQDDGQTAELVEKAGMNIEQMDYV